MELTENGRLVDSLTTGSNGRFEFQYRSTRDFDPIFVEYRYKVYAEHNHYFSDQSEKYVLSNGKIKKTVNFSLTPKAKLVVNVHNTKGGKAISFETRSIWSGKSINLGSWNQEFIVDVPANNFNIVNYTVLGQNGIKIDYDTAVYCSHYTTTTLKLEY